jgi:hypothetical protein
MDVGSTVPTSTPQRTLPPRRHWWTTHLLAGLAPVLVMLPLLAMAPKADNRFNPYRFGGEYAARPWLVVTDQLASIPEYLANGNFRPFGRMLERSLDLSTFHVSTALTVPMNVAMRLVHLVAVGVLTVTLLLVAETVTAPAPLRRTPPSHASLLLPFAFAGGLVAAGSLSTVVIFTDLYFLSSALVLGVAAAAARYQPVTERRLAPGRAIAALAIGAALASFNEIAYLAPPLALAAVAARGRLTLAVPWRELVRSAAAKAVGLGWLGFLLVFIPIRSIIASNCADGSCYDNSAVAIGVELVPALGHRLVSWIPLPVYWGVATDGSISLRAIARNPVTYVLALALAGVAVAAWRSRSERRALTRDELLALAAVGAVLLVLGAGLAAASEAVQSSVAEGWHVGSGWRETQLTVAGGSLLVTAALLALARDRPAVLTLGMVGLVGLAAATQLANQALVGTQAPIAESAVHNQIAVAVTNFVDNEDGDAVRCRLLEDFVAIHPERDDWHARLERALDAATQARYARDFCAAGVRS